MASLVDGYRTPSENEMRHRRGIDLTGGSNDNLPPKPTGIFFPQRDHPATLADLPQWYALGAQCWRCKRVGMLDRWAIQRRHGKFRSVISMEPLLRCLGCRNREKNSFVLAKRKEISHEF